MVRYWVPIPLQYTPPPCTRSPACDASRITDMQIIPNFACFIVNCNFSLWHLHVDGASVNYTSLRQSCRSSQPINQSVQHTISRKKDTLNYPSKGCKKPGVVPFVVTQWWNGLPHTTTTATTSRGITLPSRSFFKTLLFRENLLSSHL